MDHRFWQSLDHLVADLPVVVERLAGTHHPDFPGVVYPADHGHVSRTNHNGRRIGVWRGSDPIVLATGIVCTIDQLTAGGQYEALIGCTAPETAAIEAFYDNAGIASVTIVRPDRAHDGQLDHAKADAALPRPSIAGISHITLSVSSIDRSFEFYTQMLGLSPLQRNRSGAYLMAGSTWIALHVDANASTTPHRSYTHLAFYVRPAEYRAIRDRLEGADVTQWQRNTTEGDSFYFLDPDSHKLEIHASTVGERVAYAKRHWGPEITWFV